MENLKKSISNILKSQVRELELINGLIDVYVNSDEFKKSDSTNREIILELKRIQHEHLNIVNKFLKY